MFLRSRCQVLFGNEEVTQSVTAIKLRDFTSTSSVQVVIPTKVGIHYYQAIMDSRLRGNDANLMGLELG